MNRLLFSFICLSYVACPLSLNAIPPALSPSESLNSIQVPLGFKIELVASEPLVNDPVAIDWDETGRLWVVEMWGYLANQPNAGQTGRIVILEDTNQDGRMDKSSVYLDNLNNPRAISFVKDGVLIAAPPKLYYSQDKNGDDTCDSIRTIANYAKDGSYWEAENGLVYGINNWLYSAGSNRKLRFDGNDLKQRKTLERGQWGIAKDNYGRIFYTSDQDWLTGDSFPWKESNRNAGYKAKAGLSEKIATNDELFVHLANSHGNSNLDQNQAVPVSSACGPTIYRGDTFPESYQGNAFVCAPLHNMVACFRLETDGISIKGKQLLSQISDSNQTTFIGSTDQYFRPVNTSVGPDGSLYIVDMYRAQFDEYSPTQNKTGRGRIYRLAPKDQDTTPSPFPNIQKMDSAALVIYLDHSNGWWRDTAQRIIVERQSTTKSTISKLKALLSTGTELGKIHALWTLHGLGAIDNSVFELTQQDDSSWVRIHGLRTGVKQLRTASPKIINFIESALKSSDEGLRLQATQSLFHLKDQVKIQSAIRSLREHDLTKAHFQEAIVSSLSKHEANFILDLDKTPVEDSINYLPIIQKLTTALVAKQNSKDLKCLKTSFSNEGINHAVVEALTRTSLKHTRAVTDEQMSIEQRKNRLLDLLIREYLVESSVNTQN
ncbi:hypothetical protein MLD52_05730 [Puniceicoccaceae bacterium K14]|nr:hypothetical protein [Puniceicoccaceae bacterium K14]